MSDWNLLSLIVVPISLGLLGFIEPCSIGSTLLLVKHVEGASATDKIVQITVFCVTRALFIGMLGILAAVVGSAFLSLQKAAWFVLGGFYMALGMLYIAGKAGVLMRAFGPRIDGLRSPRGAVSLGLLFGLNIPACAAPLILALLGASAAGGASGTALANGFLSLALFGLTLSLPLVAAVFFESGRKALDWLAHLSHRVPVWTGVLLIVLGAWSVWFALFVSLRP